MFQIARNEEPEWRIKQAEEIKAMMFKSPQSQILQKVMEHINSEFTSRIEEEDLSVLDLASKDLEAILHRMEKLGKQVVGVQNVDGGIGGNGPDGPMLPTTHEAIHTHSRIRPHARWVWITAGPEKVTRGGEWELIKIPRRNLAYIPKSTRHPFLLTRQRPHSYSEAIDLENRVRNHSGDTKQC
jgi:hypothetical protein